MDTEHVFLEVVAFSESLKMKKKVEESLRILGNFLPSCTDDNGDSFG